MRTSMGSVVELESCTVNHGGFFPLLQHCPSHCSPSHSGSFFFFFFFFLYNNFCNSMHGITNSTANINVIQINNDDKVRMKK